MTKQTKDRHEHLFALPSRNKAESHTCGIHRLQESRSGIDSSDATEYAVYAVYAAYAADGGGDYASDNGNDNNTVLGYPI